MSHKYNQYVSFHMTLEILSFTDTGTDAGTGTDPAPKNF
jgi:hypothetical protein